MNDFKHFEWHASDVEAIFKILNSSEDGLGSLEAAQRLKKFGANNIKIKNQQTIPRILLRQLLNPIIYILLASTLLAFALQKFTDGFVVISVIVLNTIIGFVQEYKANKVISALSAIVPHETTVTRDGVQQSILASLLVPGDVVTLQAGDKVPADMRLFFVKNFECDESILTGESVPVTKNLVIENSETPVAERKNMTFGGTYATTGTCQGIVIATGMKTEFGKISELIEQVVLLETPLTLTLQKIAKWITVGVVVIGAALFGISYLRGSTLFDAGFSAVTLAVAAAPEGLPAIITIASAIGVRRMARKQAIIRQLPAVEALGSTTVICTDKTGTLSHNEMTIQKLWTPSGISTITGVGYSLEGEVVSLNDTILQQEIKPLIRAAILCSDASLNLSSNGWTPVGDPTEVAIVVVGRKLQVKEDLLRSEYPRDDVIPFDSERMMMATLNTSPSQQQSIFIKGAPEEIFQTCALDSVTRAKLVDQVNQLANAGMRVLAVAEKRCATRHGTLEENLITSGFTLLGLIGMIDPPRKEVYKAIETCFKAGIIIKMITGDHPLTAKSIAVNLGLIDEKENVMTGFELDQLTKNRWKAVSSEYNVFARVTPEHKLKLVEALQEQQHVVAMTGDGVNDAPALKRADIGIAMGVKGTAVAKEASDMILADDNFASIEYAVEEGRRVYDNLIKALVFILPTSLGQAMIIILAMLFFPVHNGTLLQPILPVQILWINLVVAVALSLPLAYETPEPDIMSRPPRKKNTPILNGFILFRTIIVSILMGTGAIALFLWEYSVEIAKGTPEQIATSEAQTMAVTAMMLFQIFYLFHCRSLKESVFQMNFFSNPSILIGVGGVLLAQLAFIYHPFMNHIFHSSGLNGEAWLISLGVALFIFFLIGLEKKFTSPTPMVST
jgi:Ca2+-transporting ATPase